MLLLFLSFSLEYFEWPLAGAPYNLSAFAFHIPITIGRGNPVLNSFGQFLEVHRREHPQRAQLGPPGLLETCVAHDIAFPSPPNTVNAPRPAIFLCAQRCRIPALQTGCLSATDNQDLSQVICPFWAHQ